MNYIIIKNEDIIKTTISDSMATLSVKNIDCVRQINYVDFLRGFLFEMSDKKEGMSVEGRLKLTKFIKTKMREVFKP